MALNISYMISHTEKIRHAFKSRNNLEQKNKGILLMITDDKKQHYLAVKKLPALLGGITSKHEGDYYCLNCFHSYSTKDRLKKHKDVCEKYDYCYQKMPKKIIKY